MVKYRAGRVTIKEPGRARVARANDTAPLFTPTDVGEAMDLWELSIDDPQSHYELGELPVTDDGGWEEMRLVLAELSFKRRRRSNGGWDSGGPEGRTGQA